MGRFGTDGVRGPVGEGLITPQGAWQVGEAMATQIARPGQPMLIGWDTRWSSEELACAMASGVESTGVIPVLLNEIPTPGVAYAARVSGSPAAMISASHNPPGDNGYKGLRPDGKLTDEDQTAIEVRLDEERKPTNLAGYQPAAVTRSYGFGYEDFLVSKVTPRRLSGVTMVFDAANGAASGMRTFSRMGANVTYVNDKPNGQNINENCGATNTAALQELVANDKNIDLAVTVDGDADRGLIVTQKGDLLDGDGIMRGLATMNKRLGREVAGVVGTLMTNIATERALEKEGIPFVRTKVGDRHVMQELVKRGWSYGGETSGHVIVDRLPGCGQLAAAKLLELCVETGTTVQEVYDEVQLMPQVTINVPLPKNYDPRSSAGKRVQEISAHYERMAAAREGRTLLRPSGTEPLMRVMAECEDADSFVEQFARDIENALNQK